MIGVLVTPCDDPKQVEYENSLAGLQEMVGGNIEMLPLYGTPFALDNIVAYCDEEGKLKGLRKTFALPFDVACGPVLFVGVDDEGNGRDLTEGECSSLIETYNCWM